MSLQAAFYGQAFKDAEVRESKAGNLFGTVLVTVPDGQDESGHNQNLFIKVVSFQDCVAELRKVKRGDRLYAEGTLSVRIFNSENGPRLDLSIKTHHVRRTAIGKDRPKRETASDKANAPPLEKSVNRESERNDELPF